MVVHYANIVFVIKQITKNAYYLEKSLDFSLLKQ